jgi:hypothetical protein
MNEKKSVDEALLRYERAMFARYLLTSHAHKTVAFSLPERQSRLILPRQACLLGRPMT